MGCNVVTVVSILLVNMSASKQASLFFPKYLYINIPNEYNIMAGCQKDHRPIKLAT